MADAALVAKWRRIADSHPDAKARSRAREVLGQLGTDQPSPDGQGPPVPGSEPGWTDRAAGRPAPVDPAEAATRSADNGPGFAERVGGKAIGAAKYLGQAVMEAPNSFKDPVGAGASAISGAAGAASLGYFGAHPRLVRAQAEVADIERLPVPTDPMMAQMRAQALERAQRNLLAAQEDAQMVEKHKLANIGGAAAVSSIVPGGLVAKGVQKALPATSAGARILASGAGAGTGAFVEGAGRGLVEGKSLGDAIVSGAEDATLGAPLGAASQAGAEGARAAGRAVTNSRGGQARQLVERQGATVGVTTPGKGGAFGPGGRLEGRRPIDRDIGEVSRESAASIITRLDDRLETEIAPFTAEKGRLRAQDEIVGPLPPEQLVDVGGLVEQGRKLLNSQRLSNAQKETIRGWIARLEGHGDPRRIGESPGPYLMSPTDLDDFRGMISDRTAGAIDPGDVPERLQGRFASSTRDVVDQTAYEAPNAGIADARGRYEQSRRLLSLDDRPRGSQVAPEGVREAEIGKVMNMMARDQQNTVTAGGRNANRLRQFAERHPEARADIEAPRALEASGDLSFKLSPDERGGLLNAVRALGPGAAGLGAGGYTAAKFLPALGLDPETAATVAAAGKVGVDLLRLNAPAIQGRLLYTPARAAGAAGEFASGYTAPAGALAPFFLRNPLDALLARKRQEQR